MEETPQALQELHEVLKASKAAKYFVKIHWPAYFKRLILESPSATESNQLLIHNSRQGTHRQVCLRRINE